MGWLFDCSTARMVDGLLAWWDLEWGDDDGDERLVACVDDDVCDDADG